MTKKCSVCGKAVYAQEIVVSSGRDFHRWCFKCHHEGCTVTLAKGKELEHEGEIYCKTHYDQNFRQAGYGTGAGLTSYTGVGSKSK